MDIDTVGATPIGNEEKSHQKGSQRKSLLPLSNVMERPPEKVVELIWLLFLRCRHRHDPPLPRVVHAAVVVVDMERHARG